MKGANLAALFTFAILWVLLTVHPKDEGDRPYDDRYIKSIAEYTNHRYEVYEGPMVALEATIEEEVTTPEEGQEFTDEETWLFVLEGMREGGVLDVDAIQAIDQTIWNRVKSRDYPNTVEGVIYQEGQFALHDNGEPNWKCYQAFENMLASPEAFPADMYWFHSEHWPNYGYPYTVIDGMYFSTETNYNTVEVDE